MCTLGALSIAGLSYYAGLPKNKKEDLKDRAIDMIKKDKCFLEEM